VKIYGDGWPRSPEWKELQSCWGGGSVYGAEYVRQVRQGRIALGLVSKGNLDLHTTRSVEIPFIGGAVFCGERTPEHQAMYREGEEAFFWSSPEECVAICRRLLADPERCARVAARARERVLASGLSNDEVLRTILGRIAEFSPPDPSKRKNQLPSV